MEFRIAEFGIPSIRNFYGIPYSVSWIPSKKFPPEFFFYGIMDTLHRCVKDAGISYIVNLFYLVTPVINNLLLYYDAIHLNFQKIFCLLAQWLHNSVHQKKRLKSLMIKQNIKNFPIYSQKTLKKLPNSRKVNFY